MRLSILLVMLLFSLPSSAGEQHLHSWVDAERQQRQNVVKITAPDENTYVKALISYHGELLEANKQTRTLVVNVNDQQLNDLQSFGFAVVPATEWLNQRDKALEKIAKSQVTKQNSGDARTTIPGFECYATVEETFDVAKSLVSQYNDLAEWIDIGDSWQKSNGGDGFDLWVLKLTNKTIQTDKPILFIHSAIHAREYTTAALTLDFARDILAQYETNADAQWILNYHEIHILLQNNPDGRKIAETGVLWRKNNNTSYCPTGNAGVDLNRNFSHHWNTTPNGSSGFECDSVFRGPTAASEPETQAVEQYVRSIFPDNRGENDNDAAPDDTPGLYIDIHSFSELILWPWGHTNEPAPNGNALEALGRKVAFFNNYVPTQSIGLYPTDGTSFDIGYGELGVASIAYELGTAFFQTCAAYESAVKPDNMPSLYYAAKVTAAPYQLAFGPDITSVSIAPSGNNVVRATMLADDGRINNQFGGTLSAQNIEEAEYFVNTPPWLSAEQGQAVEALDGTFNSSQEQLVADINTQDWPLGRNTVYFRAKDTAGNWGPVTAAFVEIQDSNTNNAPIANMIVNCENLSCSLDASGSTDDGTIDLYRWNISDNTELTGVSVTHQFGNAGTYDITLTVVDNDNAETSVQESVTVQAPPAPTPPPSNANDSSGGVMYWLVLLLGGVLTRRFAINAK